MGDDGKSFMRLQRQCWTSLTLLLVTLLRYRYKHETLKSQPLSEPPYPNQENYTEIGTNVKHSSLPDGFWLGNELRYDDPRNESKTRPAGLMAWNGPYLKYHVSTALKDYAQRIGIDVSFLEHLSVHYTGGAERGPYVIVGVQIGKRMSAEYFDIFKATGRRFFSAGEIIHGHGLDGFQKRFGYDILPASLDYAATTVGFQNGSAPFETMVKTMKKPIGVVETHLRQKGIRSQSPIGFHFICNGC